MKDCKAWKDDCRRRQVPSPPHCRVYAQGEGSSESITHVVYLHPSPTIVSHLICGYSILHGVIAPPTNESPPITWTSEQNPEYHLGSLVEGSEKSVMLFRDT